MADDVDGIVMASRPRAARSAGTPRREEAHPVKYLKPARRPKPKIPAPPFMGSAGILAKSQSLQSGQPAQTGL